MLRASLGNISASQSRKQFIRNVKRVREMYMEIVYGEDWRDLTTGAKTGTNASTTKPAAVRYDPALGKMVPVE